jgi:hypothetical protein
VSSAGPDRLLFRLGAQSAAGTPVISARMLNRDAGEMSTLPVTPAGFGGLSHIRHHLAAIPPGEYLVEVHSEGFDRDGNRRWSHSGDSVNPPSVTRWRGGLMVIIALACGVVVDAQWGRGRYSRRLIRPRYAPHACLMASSRYAASNTRELSSKTWAWAGRPTIPSPSAI